MKVRSQILLLLLLIVAAFILSVYIARHQEMARVAHLNDQSAAEIQSAFDHYLAERGRPLQLLVSPEFRDWDDLVTAATNRDLPRLATLLSENTLAAYDANAAWVLTPDSTQLTATNNVPADILSAPAFTTNLHPRLCDSPAGCHYFIHTPQGIMEIRGIALRAAWQSSPAGYLFAGRLLTNRDAADIAAATGNRVDLVSVQDVPSPEVSSDGPTVFNYHVTVAAAGFTIFTRDLNGPDGHPIASLRVIHGTPAIAVFQSATDRLSLALILFALVHLIVLAAALGFIVTTPLHTITRALHTRQLAPLQPLTRRRSEIGELAALITDFHAQRDLLVRQMDQRLAAEHALEQSQEQLRQAQKMEAIGRLAGGVAHDFNNLLTAIVGYANLLSTNPNASAETRRQAATILQAGQQAAALTAQLLAFSRKQVLQPQVIDCNILLADMERLLRRIIGENIAIRTDFQAIHALIKADPHQVEQVILNLAVNARDAMPRGGALDLRTANLTFAAAEAPDLPAGDYLLLEVADTGRGMDKDTIARIFEPFFTTKVSGKGTGLGLATVYGIVRQSGGGITVQSEPGKGSTFRVFFPRTTEPLPPAAPAPAAPQPSPGGETILVVDDQKMVAALVGDVLKAQGYTVLVAPGPSEAITHFREHKIDLLITDIVMPRIDGQTLAEMVQARHTQVKTLYVSGYADIDSPRPTNFHLLPKPFTPEALTAKVREILDR
jgi:signal transduction histidine kinase